MKGFILNTRNNGQTLSVSPSSIPPNSRGIINRKNIGNMISFTGWGSSPGDIDYVCNNEQSILLINGYISGIDLKVEFKTQQEILLSLINIFDFDHSVKNLSKIAESIYGSFSIIYVNNNDKRIYCVSDRISSRPIWFRKKQNEWVISSHANSLACIDDKIEYNYGGLGSFLLYGGPVEPKKSIYKDIFSVEPGSIIIMDMKGDSEIHSWYQYIHRPENRLEYRELVDIAADRLQKAAARVLKISPHPMIFLSGGVDSRLMASAFRSAGGEPTMVTIGDDENIEVKVAIRAAASFGCQHKIIKRDPHWYLRSLPDAAFETGGNFVWVHGHFAEAYRICLDRYGIDSSVLGDFGEAFSKLVCQYDRGTYRIWTRKQFVDEFDLLPLPPYRPAHKENTLGFLLPGTRRKMVEELEDDIGNRYDLVRNVSEDPRIIADSFLRWNNAATIATFFMFLDVRSSGPERSLMFDKDVHYLLEILPSSVRDKAHFGVNLIKKLWPSAGDVLNSNSLLPIKYPQKMHEAAIRIKPIFGKLRRIFLENSYKTTGSWQKSSLLYASDPKWRKMFENIISDRSLYDEEIFDHKEIFRCWEKFSRGDQSMYSDLEKLLEIGVLMLYRTNESRLMGYMQEFR